MKHTKPSLYLFQLFNHFCTIPSADNEEVLSESGPMISLYNLFKVIDPDVLRHEGKIHISYRDVAVFFYDRVLDETFSSIGRLKDVFVRYDSAEEIKRDRLRYDLLD